MLDIELARARQRRLLDALDDASIDAVLLTRPEHVYRYSAYLPAWRHTPALLLERSGRATVLAANGEPAHVAADDVRVYKANFRGTLRQEQPQVLADAVAMLLRDRGVSRAAIDASAAAALLLARDAGDTRDGDDGQKAFIEVDDLIHQQRRRKDADEVALMRRAIEATRAMYARARDVIEPGVSELRVFNELHAAAVESTGEPMTALLGNDFACRAGGGPPRAGKQAEAGDLYILDLGPTYRGYFSDNARTFAVDRKPTHEQSRVSQIVTGAFPLVEHLARPGVRCRDLYAELDGYFRQHLGNGLPHHLGHGVGLESHEYPHLNPDWDDVLEVGDVFTAEPGWYSAELRAGMRIENNYLVTAEGVENLTPFPTELM